MLPAPPPIYLKRTQRSGRTATTVIDQAIRENRPWEYLLFGIAIVFVIIGATMLIAGITNGWNDEKILGAVASSLFVPAATIAQKIRINNQSIRLLGELLKNAKTSDEGARILSDYVRKQLGVGDRENQR